MLDLKQTTKFNNKKKIEMFAVWLQDDRIGKNLSKDLLQYDSKQK